MASIPEQQFDVLIVGAGFGGICQAYSLRNMGLSIKLIDSLPDVGGTWLTNIYPGALSDTESFVYRFFWDQEDHKSHPWNRRYLRQPEILAYLNRIVAKHDLRKYMQFNTEMLSARWDQTTSTWEIKTNTNEMFRVRYFIPALGVLSKVYLPDIPGVSTFKGCFTHSSSWPKDLDVRNKRIGVIGCGASGVQIITNTAPVVQSLTAFIRHPQFTVPNNDRQLSPTHMKWLDENYDRIREQVNSSFSGFGFVESNRPFFSLPPERRQELLEDQWNHGNGMHFLMESFNDVVTNEKANEEVCDFLRNKIRHIVKDPEKARKLIPDELFARRPVSNDGYYETFNRKNVSIVDLKEHPIKAITPDGILTADGMVHELDVVVFATGFDAVEGNIMRVNITGRDAMVLNDAWATGPKAYLGTFVPGFPNMFIVNGPQSAFGNVPQTIQASVDLNTSAIQRAEAARRDSGSKGIVEATPAAQDAWNRLCLHHAEGSLFSKSKYSWFNGGNIPGKPNSVRAYLNGLGSFRAVWNRAVNETWEGFSPL
ncbi:flavin-binding monooxygenase [Metarhizium robertsii]|uniref:Cyclohexanone monooxygenase n=2 Tax=Metarhizium robertsii TaxID=568076 RepID=E9F2U5_METRA|nr:cyclohexanone monooxygenase [Metarhizium robertsii ARSEF 23]EFY97811.1 cyclohexanone monooxygenase [Metarhizium robertsii ARSEF 23]EXV00374.1 flavin-binding monooxygenase [Metarhizium robertsii]